MAANPDEYKSTVGLDSLYVAQVTNDSASAYAVNTPEYLAPAAEASWEPNSSMDTQYADDQAYDVSVSEGETKISLKVTAVPIELLSRMTGRVYDSNAGRMYDNAGTPPYFALSFRSLKSNGSYRYYQFLKVMFSMPKEEMTTKGEKAEPKTAELTATAIKTTYKWYLNETVGVDSIKRIVGDEDATSFSGVSWFSEVQVPTATSAAT